MGLSIYLKDTAEAAYVHTPSHLYPQHAFARRNLAAHVFDRRYLASAYDDASFDRAVPQITGDKGDTLEGIFADINWEKPEDETNDYPGGTLRAANIPQLHDAARRARAMAKKIRGIEKPLDVIRVPVLSGHINGDALDVLAWARIELSKDGRQDGYRYMSKVGQVFGVTGERVLAVALSHERDWGTVMNLVVELDPAIVEFHAQTAEIASEFAEEAIEMIKRNGSAYVGWYS